MSFENNDKRPHGFFERPAPKRPRFPSDHAPQPAQCYALYGSSPTIRTTPTRTFSLSGQSKSLWRCEPCGLEMESDKALRAHEESHVSCDLCEFSASPKVVKGHYASKHGKYSEAGFKSVSIAVPGCPVQRFRILVGNKPEDIKTWLEERRKRFPRSNRTATETKEIEPQDKVPSSALSSLLDYSSSSDDDDDGDDEGKCTEPSGQTSRVNETTVNPVSQDPVETVNRTTTNRPQPQKHRVCNAFRKYGTCRRGNQCPFSHDIIPQKTTHRRRSMLENLLQNDRKREACLTIQLLEYIHNTDYLKKPK